MGTALRRVAQRAVACIEAADWRGLGDCYATDVLLDVNLPTWRFQLQGREAVVAYFAEQTEGLANLRTTSLRAHPTDDGVVVEEEMRFDGDRGEYLWRAVDVFHVVGDEVVEHTQYCTGCWPPEDIARQQVEAPMVRW